MRVERDFGGLRRRFCLTSVRRGPIVLVISVLLIGSQLPVQEGDHFVDKSLQV